MKKWCQSEARAGRSVSPDLVNQELRAQQSSITTIDRAQMPDGGTVGFVDEDRLAQFALLQVWEDHQVDTNGEQNTERDTGVGTAAWQSSTIPTSAGGWRTLHTRTLSGFKGGSLFVEWSCNVYVNNIFANGINDGSPYSSNYMNLRILINGVNIAERRGGGYHQTSRIFGTQLFAAGDLTLSLQWRSTAQSQDAALHTSSGNKVPYAHLWNNRYIAIARYR